MKARLAHLARLYSVTAVVLLNTIIFVLLCEGVFRLVRGAAHGLNRAQRGRSAQERILGKEPWYADMVQDEKEAPVGGRYQPFEEYRSIPFRGRVTHIGEDGFRETSDLFENPKGTILMLGGSTTYGVGGPYWLSIPSYLQREMKLRHPGARFNVLNRGVPGWVISQEVIHLVQALKHGARPKIVIFYDGVNEIARAAQGGAAETTLYHWQLVDFFEGNNQLVHMVAGRRDWPGSRLVHFTFEKARRRGLNIPFIPFIEKPNYNNYTTRLYDVYPKLSDAEQQRFAEDTFENYRRSVEFAQQLSRQYGFEAYFFWQPMLYPPASQKTLTPDEAAALDREPFGYRDMARRVALMVKTFPAVINLSDTFDRTAETIFLDGAHITYRGNERVAALILQALERRSGALASTR